MTLRRTSWLNVSDNSGARLLKVLSVFGGKQESGANFVGDCFLALVKKAIPHKKVKKGERLKAVLYQTKIQQRRATGFCFNRANLVALLKKGEMLPIANRIFTKVLFELRLSGFFRVALISKGFV
jgi:large subunit ribosomal protein L14